MHFVSDNGLAPSRLQAIIWTRYALGCQCIYAPFGLNELNTSILPTCTLSWWRHQMETFCALLAICAGNSPVPGEFPTQRPVTRSCDVFYDLRLNKRLSKHWWGWWFETISRPLWRHRNGSARSVDHYGAHIYFSGLLKLMIHSNPWVLFQYKDRFSRYRISHADKTASLYWNGLQRATGPLN